MFIIVDEIGNKYFINKSDAINRTSDNKNDLQCKIINRLM